MVCNEIIKYFIKETTITDYKITIDDQRLHLVSTGFLPFLSQTIQTTIPRLPQSEQYKSIAARAACLVAEVAKAGALGLCLNCKLEFQY